ncbi:protein of unknown function DUF214 [Kribbella flavida DSM 17836]|uniref:ABC3 transporter permease C-terminal domain-containing protein n=1 Tax=Kribbella flavida (strain DSM 17836 / JCM 10339 / NBRC 14399) TaxID=479435 RepID=D2PS06_KRIFD|nr:FtsX-like permease family protein [Kribbella flavida]ADB29336.1 protein of unknown function DUF214 [Kribbella flavida DSM 17836]
MGTWGPPLRIARRTTRRALGRTLLVAALIGLPVFVATWFGVVYRTASPTGEMLAARELGSADARVDVSPYKAFGAFWAEPSLETGEPMPADGAEDPVRHPATFDPRPLLPPGTQLARAFHESGMVDLRGPGANSTVAVVTGDGRSALTAGTYRLDSGRMPATDGEVAVSPSLARHFGLLDGDQLRTGATITTSAGRQVAVVGLARTLIRPGTPTVFAVPNTALVPVATTSSVRYLADLPDTVDPVTLVRPLHGQGIRVLPRANVVDPPFGPQSTSQDSSAIAVTALIIGFGVLEIVLLAGTAFAVGARRQTRELGLITATGGTARDVRRVVLAQGLFAGVVGAGAGAGLAMVAVFTGEPLWERMTSTVFTGWQIPWLRVAVICLLGLGAGLAAAVVPAISAGRQAPMAALSGRFAATTASGRIRPVSVALLLAGITCALVGSGLIGAVYQQAKENATSDLYQPTATPTGPIALVLLGITAVIAALVWMLPGLVAKVAGLARMLPLSGRLAVRDAARHRHRTGPAAAAIMMAVAATSAAAFAVSNALAAEAEQYVPSARHGDALIRFGTGGPTAVTYSPALVERVAKLLPVKDTYSLGTVSHYSAQRTGDYLPVLATKGSPDSASGVSGAMLLAVDPAHLERFEGYGPRAAAELRAGRIVVPAADQVTNGKAALLQETGEPNPPTFGHPAAYVPGTPNVGQFRTSSLISPAAAAKLGKVQVVQVHFELNREPTEDQLSAAAVALGQDDALLIERGYQSPAKYWFAGILAAASVVTLLGVAISVSLSAAEGRADLATLAAVGAPPRRRRSLAAAQAWMLGQIGCLLGVGVGALYGYTAHAAFGSPYFAVPWREIAGIVVLVPLLAGLLAWLLTRSRLPMVSRLN